MSLLQSSPTQTHQSYLTEHHLKIERHTRSVDPATAIDGIAEVLNRHKGALFSSSFEYTGRYTRWDAGFTNPPIELRLNGDSFAITALNDRGEIILSFIKKYLPEIVSSLTFYETKGALKGVLPASQPVDDESERTRQPSIFDILRGFKELFHMPDDQFLGLYGAFGYDLIYQLEPGEKKIPRDADQSDLVLYMPDELVMVDRKLEKAHQITYEFSYKKETTSGKTRGSKKINPTRSEEDLPHYKEGYYKQLVEQAMPAFHEGELYEVVPSQVIKKKCDDKPSDIFHRLKKLNPSPYGFLINLGDEHLVGASPEMFVRVEGERVETCPISGTIRRGKDALEDAEQIRKLLDSKKDEIELTMCTDVDRNDKSRICEPGSVKVIGRRQIEAYSHLFHTVDHIEGILRPEYDALDAFMTHMWAVTVTGSPKPEAVKWIESHEASARGWYGGAVGFYTFDGRLNTGLTLRTARIKNGVGEVRVGATVLHASDPAAEEEETLVKAKALLKVLEGDEGKGVHRNGSTPGISHKDKRILLIDHEDSFVHTLANYLRQTGAEVIVSRPDAARSQLNRDVSFDLVVLSPGPGRPERFNMSETIRLSLEKKFPLFGVCLGFQGLAEYFGGTLGKLSTPCHGEKSRLNLLLGDPVLFQEIEEPVEVGRYHSLYIDKLPQGFVTEAEVEGILMAGRHETLPVAGVQFHPESILSQKHKQGLQLIRNVMELLVQK